MIRRLFGGHTTGANFFFNDGVIVSLAQQLACGCQSIET
jgi:hypothetical protein